jgi:outer membrane immunogenic protein
MFKNLLAATAALALSASPALAQTNAAFVGPRAEVSLGLADVDNTENVTYTGNVGLDLSATDRLTLGVDAEISDAFEGNRDFGVGARAGFALTPGAQVFGRVGYSHVDLNDNSAELNGLTVGGGLQFRITDHTYASTEYRYTDFRQNQGAHGARIGLGVRF